MKNSILCCLFGITILLSGCNRSSWVGLSIPQSGLIGKKINGIPKRNEVFSSLFFNHSAIDITSENAPNSLTRSFERETKFSLDKIFSTSTSKIDNITAKDVKIDYFNNYPDAPPSVDFVYSGARASEVYIRYKRDVNIEASALELLKTISNVRGSLGIVDSLLSLKDSIKIKNKVEFIDTIKNSKVYFLLQIGNINLPNSEIWNTYGKSFSSNTSLQTFKLTNTSGNEKSKLIQPKYYLSGSVSKNVTDVWLQVEKNDENKLELYVCYNEVGTNTLTQKKKIANRKVGDDIIWDVNKFTFYQFPISKTKYKILSISIYGKLVDNGSSIEFTNLTNGIYKTFLYYPESDIQFNKY